MNTQVLQNSIKTISVSKHISTSYQELKKTAIVLKSIVKVYFPIYNISENDFFDYFPLLNFIELLVYETDAETEEAQANSSSPIQASIIWNSKKKIIQYLLKELKLEHPTIEAALENVGYFFDLESQIMAAETINYADIIRVSEMRSCDLRLLHCTLIQMSGNYYKQEIFDLLLPFEIIVEWNDDIFSYKKDLADRHYNTYWMFERMYGEEAPHYLQAEIERYRNLFEERLKLFSEDEQKIYLKKWSRFWNNFSYLSNAELIRTTALEGDCNEE